MFIKISHSRKIRDRLITSSYSIHEDNHLELARVMKETQKLSKLHDDFQIRMN